MKEKVVPTLANIILVTDQILQPHYDYDQGLLRTGPDREITEDYLKEHLEFKYQALLNQNLNHLKLLMNLWKW